MNVNIKCCRTVTLNVLKLFAPYTDLKNEARRCPAGGEHKDLQRAHLCARNIFFVICKTILNASRQQDWILGCHYLFRNGEQKHVNVVILIVSSVEAFIKVGSSQRQNMFVLSIISHLGIISSISVTDSIELQRYYSDGTSVRNKCCLYFSVTTIQQIECNRLLVSAATCRSLSVHNLIRIEIHTAFSLLIHIRRYMEQTILLTGKA